MEILAYWVIALVVGIIFLPEYEGAEFRNIPLFIIIVSIAIILTLIKLLRYVFFVLKVKKMLLKNGYEVTQCHFLPNFKNSKNYHLSAKKENEALNIYIAKRKNSYVTYLFEDENTVQLYKHARMALINPTVGQKYIVSPHVEAKKSGNIYFFWHEEDFSENTKNILLFKKLPNTVKDTKHPLPIDNGDKINDKVYLYDIKAFDRFINN